MLDLPLSITAQEQAQRTSSVAPALSALQRAIAERKGYRSQQTADIVREQAEKDAHYIAPDGTRLRHVKDAGMGNPMTGKEVQRRLQRIAPQLIFEDSPVPGRICINYFAHDPVLGEVKHNVCSMERGLMPEFSILNVVEEPMMNKETGKIETLRKINEKNPEQRGWRTVLAKLIRSGMVGQSAVERLFGTPSHTSKKWQDAICR